MSIKIIVRFWAVGSLKKEHALTSAAYQRCFMIMPVDIGIDMPIQRNKQTKGLVFEKYLDRTLVLGVHQHSDRPANKIHRRFKEFAVDTDTAVIG